MAAVAREVRATQFRVPRGGRHAVDFCRSADGGDAGDTRTQVKMVFERLGSVVFETGSSDRHSVKAS